MATLQTMHGFCDSSESRAVEPGEAGSNFSQFLDRRDEVGEIAREIQSIEEAMDSLLNTLNGFIRRHA